MGNSSTHHAAPIQEVSRPGLATLEIIQIGDTVWFSADSLAVALQLDSEELLRKIAAPDRQLFYVTRHAQQARALFLSEPAFYQAVFTKAIAEADSVMRWVFNDVLPEMRRTGQYKLQEDARRLGVSFNFTDQQWEWLKLKPHLLDVLPLAAAGYNSVEITRILGRKTPSGITVRKQIDRLKQLGFLPRVIEPREKQLERLILGQRPDRRGQRNQFETGK